MVNRFSPEDEEHLAKRLRREAATSRPQFSEALHQRIHRAVRASTDRLAEPAKHAGRAGRFAGSPRLSQWVLAAAVALAAVLPMLSWRSHPRRAAETAMRPAEDRSSTARSGDSSRQSATDAADSPAESTVENLAGFIQSQPPLKQLPGLDHDVRTALETLTDHIAFDVPVSLVSAEPLPEQVQQ